MYKPKKIWLSSWPKKQNQNAQKFWLHLTGGTKMMAMAAQDSFKKHSKTTKAVQLGSYYMPFGGKLLHKIYPSAKSKKLLSSILHLKSILALMATKLNLRPQNLAPLK